MGPWQNYLIILQQDLLALARMLVLVAGAMLVHAGLIAIAIAARHRVLRQRAIWVAVLICWMVSTIAAVGTYLLGLGLASRLYQSWHVDLKEVPPYFWLALISVSTGIAFVLAYRHTAAWLQAAIENKRASLRISFSLRTLILYELVLIVGIGLWIECRRDWVMEQYREQAERARVAEHERWTTSLVERFGRHWVIGHSKLNDPQRYLELTLEKYPTQWDSFPNVQAEVIGRLHPDDGLTRLHFRSDNLTGDELKQLSEQKSLTDLYIVSQSLRDADVAELRKFPSLQHLILRCPDLTDKSLDILIGMEAQIWLESPLVTKATVESPRGKREGKWMILAGVPRK